MNKQQLTDSVKTLLMLEWFGIQIEEVKDERENFSYMTKTIYCYSVPESSNIEVDDKKLNDKIKTSDGLKILAKETLTDLLINSCKEQDPDEDFINDIKNNTSNYLKFRARVRNGEIWNKEMGNNRVKELSKDIQKLAKYTEV